MRYFNFKYSKKCMTCKKVVNCNGNLPKCSVATKIEGVLADNADKPATVKDDLLSQLLFNNSCDEFESAFMEEKSVKSFDIQDFYYNDASKELMSKMVRICNPFDKEPKTYSAYNIGFLPIAPDIDVTEKDKIYFYNNYALAFFVPEINNIIFASQCIWFPVSEDEEIKEITQEEIKYFKMNEENILSINYPRFTELLKNEKENDSPIVS